MMLNMYSQLREIWFWILSTITPDRINPCSRRVAFGFEIPRPIPCWLMWKCFFSFDPQNTIMVSVNFILSSRFFMAIIQFTNNFASWEQSSKCTSLFAMHMSHCPYLKFPSYPIICSSLDARYLSLMQYFTILFKRSKQLSHLISTFVYISEVHTAIVKGKI